MEEAGSGGNRFASILAKTFPPGEGKLSQQRSCGPLPLFPDPDHPLVGLLPVLFSVAWKRSTGFGVLWRAGAGLGGKEASPGLGRDCNRMANTGTLFPGFL